MHCGLVSLTGEDVRARTKYAEHLQWWENQFEVGTNIRQGSPVWVWGTPLIHLLPHLFPFYFSLSFIGFTYFLLLFIPSLSTRIVPLRFQAGGPRRRPNLGLVCFLCNLCYLYSLVKMDCGVLFGLVLCVPSVLWHCWLVHLTCKNPSPIWPIMCLVGC